MTGQSFYFDTVCQITVYDEDPPEGIIDDVFALCAEYEELFSRTRKGSDICRINEAKGEPVSVDERTAELIQKGIDFGELSGGLFDITVGTLTELWDFKSEEALVPEAEIIREALSHVDYRGVVLEGNRVRLTDPKAKLDLGGLAKGYAADGVSRYLKERGIKSAVISLGGNVVCIGKKQARGKESYFRVGVETPFSDRQEVTKMLELSDETAVTSGVYERYFEREGKRYHHILDPKTGYPAKTDLLSVTVTAEEGKSCDCDAFSTICLMLGAEKGEEFLDQHPGFEGYFIRE